MIHQRNTMIVARILGIFGGQSIDGAFSITERYNPKMDKWSTEEEEGGKTDIGPYVSDKNEILNTKIDSTPN